LVEYLAPHRIGERAEHEIEGFVGVFHAVILLNRSDDNQLFC
jgi:hypothetical protein